MPNECNTLESKLKLLLIFLLFIEASCKPKQPEFTTVNDLSEPIKITGWRLAGPFYPDTIHLAEESYLNANFLKNTGDEEQLSMDLTNPDTKAPLFQKISNDRFKPFLNLLGVVKTPSVVYLMTQLNSKHPQDVMLLINSFQQMKLWINNKFTYQSEWKPSNSKYYEEYIPVKLKAGSNLLMVKLAYTDTSSNHWTFNAYAASTTYGKQNFLKDYGFFFVKKSILNIGQNLEAYLGPFINDTNAKIEITNTRQKKTYTQALFNKIDKETGTVSLKIGPQFTDQLLEAKLITGTDTITQNCFYGDFNNKVNQVQSVYKQLIIKCRSEGLKLNSQAVYNRLIFAINKKPKGKDLSRKFVIRHWDRTRIWFYKDLLGKINLLKKHSYTPGDDKGIIKAFRATDKTNYYILHANSPSAHKQPLLVIIPFPAKKYVPFLESWSLSNFEELEPTFKLADQHNFAVMWPDPENYDLEVNDINKIFASIKDAEKYAAIDTSRIFLLGNCSAAPNTFLLAESYPQKFAGCAFVNPIRIFHANFDQLGKLHLFFKLTSNDEVIPVEKTIEFYKANKSKIPYSKLLLTHQGSHYVAPKDNYKEIFQFFSLVKSKLKEQ